MGSKKKQKQQVADYYLAMHYGYCYGPIDAIKAVYIGEKEVWRGSASSGAIPVRKRNMLGGPKEEGGYEGDITILQGGPSQVLPSWMANRMAPAGRVPGFRGVLSLFFAGAGNSGGFYWGSNTPYIRDVWVKMFCRPKGFYPEKAVIARANPKDPDLDANPAHIIFECATNGEWGAGTAVSQIDLDSIKSAADRLFDEGFGLSLIFSGQQPVKDFIADICRHIDATFDVDPRTGLYVLNLIRGDYVIDDLPEINPSNFKLRAFSRRTWSETVNEVSVTWTNPVNEEQETVTYHDLGNIAQQRGNIVSETLTFDGIRSAELALRVAEREAARRGSPLAALEGEVNRAGAEWMPGQVILFTWPKLGIYRLPVRLGSVDRGSPGSPGVTITAVEDEFALPSNPYTRPPVSEWEDPSSEPFPLTNVLPVAIPYFLLVQDVGSDEASAIEVPDTYLAVLASTSNDDAYAFSLSALGVDITGEPAWVDLGLKSLTPYATLPSALPRATTSSVQGFQNISGGGNPVRGTLLWVGTSGADNEIMLVTDVSPLGVLTVRRGCLDTVPRAWPAGAPVWFYDPQLAIEDDTTRSMGAQVQYKLLTETSKGRLPLADAPMVSVTAEARATLPLRPANVRINGVLWPSVVTGDFTALALSWANRNRLLEVDVVQSWTAGNVSPEVGATVSVRLLDHTGAQVSADTGLSGTAYALDASGLTGPTATLQVWAVRNGARSYQIEETTFTVAGYGMNYGNYYGGV